VRGPAPGFLQMLLQLHLGISSALENTKGQGSSGMAVFAFQHRRYLPRRNRIIYAARPGKHPHLGPTGLVSWNSGRASWSSLRVRQHL